jgi:hypothetical protein
MKYWKLIGSAMLAVAARAHGHRQTSSPYLSVYRPNGSNCELKDCHGKEPNSNDTSEGCPRPVVIERHGDARKQAQ